MRLLVDSQKSKVYLTGTGLGSLSAAIYLIQEANYNPANIHIFEENGEDLLGGCCDAEKDEEKCCYFMRGSRMLEDKVYTCTKDIFSRTPLIDNPNKTVMEQHSEHWDEYHFDTVVRLFGDHQKKDSGHDLGVSFKDVINLGKLSVASEKKLGKKTIEDVFTPEFFKSNFWYMFRTTFAFHTYHSAVEMKRYLNLFMHEFPRCNTMAGVQRTRYNNYETYILPMLTYLKSKGVNFHTNTKVIDVDFLCEDNRRTITRLYLESATKGKQIIDVLVNDRVFLTMGSMVADHTYGTNDKPAPFPESKNPGTMHSSWKLWEKVAKNQPDFGRPEVFTRNIEESKFLSFTITFKDRVFREKYEELVEREMGKTGQFTMYDSPWFLTFCPFRQPVFIDQPEGTCVSWGYGLYDDQLGKYVKKRMRDCSGREMLEEMLGHMGFDEEKEDILNNSITIPSFLPYGISQFLTRVEGDRPQVVPKNAANFTFLGQYTEIPKHTVFTTEYSIRSAMIAIKKLVKPDLKIPRIYFGRRHPVKLVRCIRTFFRK